MARMRLCNLPYLSSITRHRKTDAHPPKWVEICFGSRGSEVRILSPRPISLTGTVFCVVNASCPKNRTSQLSAVNMIPPRGRLSPGYQSPTSRCGVGTWGSSCPRAGFFIDERSLPGNLRGAQPSNKGRRFESPSPKGDGGRYQVLIGDFHTIQDLEPNPTQANLPSSPARTSPRQR